MRILLIGLTLCFIACSKSEYNEMLLSRLKEIKNLKNYNNTVVVYPDSFRIIIYSDKNHQFNPYHPYQFLRDSAKIEDLENLLFSDHPYIRTYAFAALSFRNYNKLYQIVLKNLEDKTKVKCFTDDYGFESTVPDMMLQYAVEKFDTSQRNTIAQLILTKYNHLKTLNEILLFHKPNPLHYSTIKEIVKKGFTGKFGIVALSRYQEVGDIELLKFGFKTNDYYSGYKVFFMAIEYFTNEGFKQDLISYKNQINKGFDMSGLDYYFNALAKFHDRSCIKVLNEFVYQRQYACGSYKKNNLSMIYRSLKKYYIPDYESMIKFIETNVSKDELNFDDNNLMNNSWNY